MWLGASAQVRVNNVNVSKKGEALEVSFEAQIDKKAVKPNYKVVITPVVEGSGEHATLGEIVVQPRRNRIVEQRNGIKPTAGAIYASNGDKVTYAASIPYQKWMNGAVLKLDMMQSGCCTDKNLLGSELCNIKSVPDPIPVYNVSVELAYITPAAEAAKVRELSGRAYIQFRVNRSELLPDFANNAMELAKIDNSINSVKNDKFTSVTSISMVGTASPEGTWASNSKLAKDRAWAVSWYVKNKFSEYATLVSVDSYPENWSGLKELVEGSSSLSTGERERILAIVNSVLGASRVDVERVSNGADRSMVALGELYRIMLSDYYPLLRRTDYTISYNVRGLNVEESKEVLVKNPKNLSLNEMFMVAQTYRAGSKEFIEVFEIAARTFPADAVANINAAVSQYESGNVEGAKRFLARVEGGEQYGEYENLMGLIALSRGDYAAAEQHLKSAERKGLPAAKRNLEELARKVENARAIEQREKEL